MATVHFTSDLHLGHKLVSDLRGFASTEDHDAAIAENWVSQVKSRDTVWVLGDLSMKDHRSALALIKDLPGLKHLIVGNHDPVSPIHRNSHRFQREYLEVFESVQAYARVRIAAQTVLMSHFPYDGPAGEADHLEEVRYRQYRLPNEGAWLLHGHTHLSEQFVHGNQIHVGLDAHELSPVPHEKIEKIIA